MKFNNEWAVVKGKTGNWLKYIENNLLVAFTLILKSNIGHQLSRAQWTGTESYGVQ